MRGSMLQLLSTLTTRTALAEQLGQQGYGGDRDLYEALGYKTEITFKDYLARYTRQDIAKAVIDRPIKATWQGDFTVVDTAEGETALQDAWKELNDKIKIKSQFMRLDRLTGLGRYGVLLFGFTDTGDRTGFARPVAGDTKELVYLKSYSEDVAEIATYVKSGNDPRFGHPETYRITVMDPSSQRSDIVTVHHSRTLHITDDTLKSEVEGIPRMEAIFNRLMDIEKLVGGDAEMFWRGARPGYVGSLKEDYTMTDTTKDDLQDQIDEFEHHLRRFLINEGIELKALEQQLADPSNHVDVQLQMISAVTGIPKRILTGSERGELSSDQDKAEYLAYVKSRREEFAEIKIVKPFVDRCIEYGILPAPKDEYKIQWEDLFAPSQKEKAEIGKAMSFSLREYTQNPTAEAVIPPDLFLKHMLKLTDKEIEEIQQTRGAEVAEELAAIRESMQQQKVIDGTADSDTGTD